MKQWAAHYFRMSSSSKSWQAIHLNSKIARANAMDRKSLPHLPRTQENTWQAAEAAPPPPCPPRPTSLMCWAAAHRRPPRPGARPWVALGWHCYRWLGRSRKSSDLLVDLIMWMLICWEAHIWIIQTSNIAILDQHTSLVLEIVRYLTVAILHCQHKC